MPIRHIAVDSRDCKPGTLFIACRGQSEDGYRYIREAVSRGARAVILEKWASDNPGVTQVKTADARRAVPRVAARFYRFPAKKLKLFAVTGTNGKSTTAAWLAHLLKALGSSAGLIGTVRYETGGRPVSALHTTPDPLRLQRLLADMVRRRLRSAVLEVSSHALAQGRVDGLFFTASVFTNLTRDHLDYHRTFARYFSAKKSLFFRPLAPKTAVLNADDAYGRRLIRCIRSPRITYGLRNRADLRARIQSVDFSGTRWSVDYKDRQCFVESPLIGAYNVSNGLAAIGAGLAAGFKLEHLAEAAGRFKGVPGRLERLGRKQSFYTFVDYAHTHDALDKALGTLQKLRPRRLIVVFGCGGDRDRGKRARMGRIAGRRADTVVLTSDNPRHESPSRIISDIRKGVRGTSSRCLEIVDRHEALCEAVRHARKGDLVLVAGKGHETTQISNGRALPFDDRAVLRKLVGR